MSRILKVMLAIGALCLCALLAVSAYFLPRIIRSVRGVYDAWFDESYYQLVAALNERSGTDDRVSSATAAFFFPINPEGPETLLDVQLRTTMLCTLEEGDPCESLTDEYARLALEHYARLDAIDGLRVTVNSGVGLGPLQFRRTISSLLTIEEWQQRLDEDATNDA